MQAAQTDQVANDAIKNNNSFRQGQRTSSLISSNASNDQDAIKYSSQSAIGTKLDSQNNNNYESISKQSSLSKSGKKAPQTKKSNQWKSPFQAHQERSEAQKQMLKYMVQS